MRLAGASAVLDRAGVGSHPCRVVIERLGSTRRALVALPAATLGEPAGRHPTADCVDALRLQLDCPQQELTGPQRTRLRARATHSRMRGRRGRRSARPCTTLALGILPAPPGTGAT